MAEAFKRAQDSGSFSLEDFGTILESGEGSDVPSDVQKRMERDYGAKHNYEDLLLAVIEDLKRRQPA